MGFGEYSFSLVKEAIKDHVAWNKQLPLCVRVEKFLRAGATKAQVNALVDLYQVWRISEIGEWEGEPTPVTIDPELFRSLNS